MWRCDEEQSGCHGFGPCPKEAWPYGHNSTAPCVHDPHPSWVRLDGMSGGMGRPLPALSCALVPDPDVLVPVSFRGVGGGPGEARMGGMHGAARRKWLWGHPTPISILWVETKHAPWYGLAGVFVSLPPSIRRPSDSIGLNLPFDLLTACPHPRPPPTHTHTLQAPLYAALRRTRDMHWLSRSGTRESMMRLCTSACGTGTHTPRKPWTRCG